LEYTAETLNRSTGDLVLTSLGNYLTVTEFGKERDKGPREIRAILFHMGLLRNEGRHGRYRLPPSAVAAGYGKRHETPKSGFPFDTLSPLGQRLIAEAWDHTVSDLENELAQSPTTLRAKAELAAFSNDRGRVLKTQEAVSWLQFRFPDLLHRQMATILSVSEQLVGRYVTAAAEQLAFRKQEQARKLPHLSPLQRLENRWLHARPEAPKQPAKY